MALREQPERDARATAGHLVNGIQSTVPNPHARWIADQVCDFSQQSTPPANHTPTCEERSTGHESRLTSTETSECNPGHLTSGRDAKSVWRLSSSSDPAALAVVDGTGRFTGHGPHYSRRTRGSLTFTGVGREVVLVTECGRAVWAVVYQRTPSAVGSGGSRGRDGESDARPRYLWRNMLFRNLGAGLSSSLILEATERTCEEWVIRYGELPLEPLRTEVDVRAVKSQNPGYCYIRAGWRPGEVRRGKRFLYAPLRVVDEDTARAPARPGPAPTLALAGGAR